jgi:hypothetical protein
VTDPYGGGGSVPPVPTTEVQPLPHIGVPHAGASEMPVTGGDVIVLTLFALAAIGLGVALKLRRWSLPSWEREG